MIIHVTVEWDRRSFVFVFQREGMNERRKKETRSSQADKKVKRQTA